MNRMRDTGRTLLLCLPVVLAGFMAGCSSGAHSTASRPIDTSQSADSSQPIYLAQTTCWDTESCCILKDPLTAADRCMVRPERIVGAVNRARELYGTIQRGARLKEDAQAKEDAEFAEAAEAEGEAAPEPPDCQGQNHHVISRPIAKALEEHKTHCGYQKWHRDVDLEIIEWLRRYDEATPEQFMKMLREIYSRKDMLKRFPNGFGPAT